VKVPVKVSGTLWVPSVTVSLVVRCVEHVRLDAGGNHVGDIDRIAAAEALDGVSGQIGGGSEEGVADADYDTGVFRIVDRYTKGRSFVFALFG
jgi:hypothetical protein